VFGVWFFFDDLTKAGFEQCFSMMKQPWRRLHKQAYLLFRASGKPAYTSSKRWLSTASFPWTLCWINLGSTRGKRTLVCKSGLGRTESSWCHYAAGSTLDVWVTTLNLASEEAKLNDYYLDIETIGLAGLNEKIRLTEMRFTRNKLRGHIFWIIRGLVMSRFAHSKSLAYITHFAERNTARNLSIRRY